MLFMSLNVKHVIGELSRLKKVSAILASLLFALNGCGSEAGLPSPGNSEQIQGNHLPVVLTATILPVPLTLNGSISVQISAEDPDRDAISFQHRWFVNDMPVPGQSQPSLGSEFLKRGDHVSVEVTPSDGKGQGAAYKSKSFIVENTPPIVRSVQLTPLPVHAGQRLQAKPEALDFDHDAIHYIFRWLRNGAEVQEGEADVLETKGFVPRDLIVAEVIPVDPFSKGKAYRSDAIAIDNSPPTIISTPSSPTTLERYEYAVQAIDPDGDRLSFSLRAEPPGMTIDHVSGLLIWRITPGTSGMHHAQIIVEDGQGGTTTQEINLTLPTPVSS